jgi:hypothetical protein
MRFLVDSASTAYPQETRDSDGDDTLTVES